MTKKKPSARGNGHAPTRMTAGARGGLGLNSLFAENLLLERRAFLRQLLDPRRDIDAECGHPETVGVADYKKLFLRGDIATRVVTVLPEESWSESPDVFETEEEEETEFEKAWIALEEEFQFYSVLERLDILSGIGRFGILLLGIDDGLPLDQPAMMINPDPNEGDGTPAPVPVQRKLLYVRPFDEELVTIGELESNVNSPRYGLPTSYQIRFEDANNTTNIGGAAVSGKSFNNEVHWSRVIHVADNRTSSDVYGLPRMEKVVNRLLDIKKIAGGSGEMFWKGGFPGLALEAPVDAEEAVEIDVDDVKEQMDRYMNGLQRYLAIVGVQAKSLGVQVADPSPHIDGQIKLIAMAMGVPWRVFVGSEAAQLASEQDSRSWHRRLNRRRQKHLTPYVITPTIKRLISFGILPQPQELQVFWPDLNTLSEIDQSTVANNLTNAMAKYVQAGADLLMDPFHFLTLIMKLEDDEARSIIDEIEHKLIDSDPALPQNQPPVPAAPGQPPARPRTQPRQPQPRE